MLRWTVEIAIADSWIVDGFLVTADNVHDAVIESLLPYAYEEEVQVKVIKGPTQKQLNTIEEAAMAKEE